KNAKEVFDESLNQRNMVVSNFQTDITVYETSSADIAGAEPALQAVDQHSIQVNHPYRSGSYELYQSSYDNTQLKSLTFRLEDSDGNTVGENVTVNLDNLEESHQVNEDIEINMRAYAPDFLEIDENGSLVSETPVPNDPAFVFETNDGEDSELSLLQVMISTDITENNDYNIRFVESEEHIASVLTLKKDLTVPF